MLFNSQEFILVFIPILVLIFYTAKSRTENIHITILIFFSLAFYSFWEIKDIIIVITSILFNYFIALLIKKYNNKSIVVLGIILNLSVLFYYKYLILFLTLISVKNENISNLPLGISFFTFTQIVFLMDVYIKKYRDFNFKNYFLFVVYFPHLVAGPLVVYRDLNPQFKDLKTRIINHENILIGLTIFSIGLAKKVIFADNLALYVNSIFQAYDTPQSINFFYAWTGAIAYSMQLYFDFSGYTDMAIGISKIFNINLPINFNSPYKSKNIIEFWRRWHITLSNFLRDYLYIPLGGNKNRFLSLLLTMLLGGLWHGANLTFVFWGGLHAVFIYLNYLFHKLTDLLQIPKSFVPNYLAIFITFVCVTFAWVFFRAESVEKGLLITFDMSIRIIDIINFKFSGEFKSYLTLMRESDLSMRILLILFISSSIVIWALPNTYQYINKSNKLLIFKATIYEVLFFATLLLISILSISSKKEFIYFNF